MLDTREKDIFARDVLSSSYDLDVIGVDPLSAAANSLAELEELLSLNSPDVMAKRARHFAVPGTCEDDYSEKFYRIDGGRTVLAGIRHMSADVAHPFVHLTLPFVPTKNDLESLVEFSRRTFSKFAPKQLSFHSRPSGGVGALDPDLVPARNYVAGRVTGLRSRPEPAGLERVSFGVFDFAKDWAWYEQAYAEFHRANPELVLRVPITDEEELGGCASDGWIFKVWVDGEVAGLVAARNEVFLGRPGAYMTELLLVPPFKRQGLAVALQRKFINELSVQTELLWGTIDAKNLASRKTAERVGRVVVRSEYFLKI